MTIFGLVRHGQTEYNREGRFQGSSDIPLNETGRDQARVALDAVNDLPWDVVVSSPLLRAAETADIVAAGLDLEVTERRSDLVERDWGWAEGRKEEEAEAAYPNRDFPGVEDRDAVTRRGLNALEDLAATYPDGRVLLISHGSIIKYIVAAVLDYEPDGVHNAAISVIDVDGDRWTISYLGGEKIEPAVTSRIDSSLSLARLPE